MESIFLAAKCYYLRCENDDDNVAKFKGSSSAFTYEQYNAVVSYDQPLSSQTTHLRATNSRG
jgi:hypothetical protein